jgi:hypothetical protein
MAERLPEGYTARYVSEAVEKRPARAIRIAGIAAGWALVEEDLALLYSYLLGTGERSAKRRRHTLDPVGIQVFEALHALNNRIDLLNRLAKWRSPAGEQATITQLSTEVRRVSLLRNRIVHGLWGICDDFPDDLVLHGTLEEPEARIYKDHDLKQVLVRVRALHANLYELVKKMSTRLNREGLKL